MVGFYRLSAHEAGSDTSKAIDFHGGSLLHSNQLRKDADVIIFDIDVQEQSYSHYSFRFLARPV